MLIHENEPAWWYMEVPRTATTTTTAILRQLFSSSYAPYAKHWPLPPPSPLRKANSLINVRNPFSRAVSCWQFFTKPGSVSFLQWTEDRLKTGFVDVQIEARPQSFWYELADWDYELKQEAYEADMLVFLKDMGLAYSEINCPVLNATGSEWLNRVHCKTVRDRHWYEYYCPQAEANIKELYAKDFLNLCHFYTNDLSSCIDKLNRV